MNMALGKVTRTTTATAGIQMVHILVTSTTASTDGGGIMISKTIVVGKATTVKTTAITDETMITRATTIATLAVIQTTMVNGASHTLTMTMDTAIMIDSIETAEGILQVLDIETQIEIVGDISKETALLLVCEGMKIGTDIPVLPIRIETPHTVESDGMMAITKSATTVTIGMDIESAGHLATGAPTPALHDVVISSSAIHHVCNERNDAQWQYKLLYYINFCYFAPFHRTISTYYRSI